MAAELDLADEGDLLLSLFSTDSVLLLSPATKRVKWILSGRYIHQHSPRVLEDNRLLIFDNRGGDRELGGSRVVRQSLDGNGFAVVWPRPGSKAFTPYAGYIDVGPGGETALVSVADMGEIVEIDLDSGDVLWRYKKVFPMEGFPGARTDKGASILTSAFGANYVDDSFRRLFQSHAEASAGHLAARERNSRGEAR